MVRLIKIGLVTILALIVTLLFVLAFTMDKVIHAGVETIGSTLTRTEIRLDEVNISPLDGHGALKGFFIGNPKGFKSDKAFYLGEVEVDIELLSLFSERFLIERIYISEPQIVLENSSKGNNLTQLRNNVNEVVKRRENNKEELVRFEITEFILEGGSVEIIMPTRNMTIPVPRIEFHDMGKESGGITSDELVKEILSKVTINVELKVRDVPGLAVGVGFDVTDKVGNAAKGSVKGIKKFIGKARINK